MITDPLLFNFTFDVDGTLTPSRKCIDSSFEKWFLSFCQTNNVYLVTGSDYEKTLEQLGEDICNTVKGVYSCCGNALYIKGQLQYQNDFTLTQEQRDFLNSLLDESGFPIKTGKHIEERIGLVNFSILGRNATHDQRQFYMGYDYATHERHNLLEKIQSKFPDIEANLGGETGIDIYYKGRDKSQIADQIKPFIFFGDKIYPGGNDFAIASGAYQYYSVEDWKETFEILKENYSC